MKKLLLFMIILIGYNTNAQLTNLQVYDYEIGDVFQVTYDGAAVGPAPIETDTVINKYYSVGMDTLYYVMNHLTYTAAFPPNPSPTYNFSIDTIVITDLGLPAEHFIYQYTCLPATDTTLIDNCGNMFERYHSNADSTCFEPQTWHSDLYTGLGGPYYYMSDPTLFGSGMEWYSKSLTYYNSTQQGECGVFQSFVGLDELTELFNVRIYPNPASKELHISTQSENWNYSIFTCGGKVVNSENVIGQEYTIDISDLKEGYYFIQISNRSYVKTFSIVKR